MKSFFFSGLAGFAVAVQRFTVEHFDESFAWPISLIVTGVLGMLLSCLIPRWQAQQKLRAATKESQAAKKKWLIRFSRTS